ncbi:acetyltransferase [Colletotrichum plurivorum]|uniref:Acetyltransferase n=1 Tax=Colletotrichum plurivorum TaxID=2175906 RepID=A0A8H6J7B5_9PEZI|nr:acetyltransferase [Colletotrichum plurivorum]
MTGIEIRPANFNDTAAVVAFIAKARADMFPMLDAESRQQHAKSELANFQRTYLDHPHGAFLVALSKGRLIATAAYQPYDHRFPQLDLMREDVVEVVRLYVDPAWRRAGLASSLVSALEQMAQQAKVKQLYLHTHPFLPGAVCFWERQGFHVLEVEDDPVWQTTHMRRTVCGRGQCSLRQPCLLAA